MLYYYFLLTINTKQYDRINSYYETIRPFKRISIIIRIIIMIIKRIIRKKIIMSIKNLDALKNYFFLHYRFDNSVVSLL